MIYSKIHICDLCGLHEHCTCVSSKILLEDNRMNNRVDNWVDNRVDDQADNQADNQVDNPADNQMQKK